MSPSDPDRDPVDVLAEEFADQLRRGERPSVSDYAAAHPELADQLLDLLPAVAQMEQLKQFRKAAPAAGRKSFPARLGDFRIVRELGRGGMGVVFEAVQESLGRRVALKVLSSHSQLDGERRERFVREAKAAARLHHTNIVPVFGVGEQDGLPYYVMQLIPGRGLYGVVSRWREAAGRETRGAAGTVDTAVVVVEGRSPPPASEPHSGPETWVGDAPESGNWAFVAGIGIQAAEALQHAHENGVLHRDVKPGNLLLDDRGQVWVTDFGLAKLVDHHGLTETGHILGTLQYMAPESLHGEADARSDVYGLGATLYELLTLSLPLTEAPPARMMMQLEHEDPTPPRQLNPDIPRDLETIVLKAMAREPGRRYASAGEFAADLRAFLDDRPIRARRESWAARGLRLCRRNPVVALLSSITVAALLLATVVGWVGYVRTKAAFAAEEKKRGEAEEASAKLEANLRLSLAAFEKVFEAAGGDEFRPGAGPRTGGPPGAPDGPNTGEAADKAAMLEAVLAFYDRFAEQNATNPRLRFEAAKAHRRVAEMHHWLGRDEKAAASFRRAMGLLDGLETEYPTDDEVRFEIMLAHANAPDGDGGVEAQLLRAADYGRGFTGPPKRWSVGTVYLKLGWAREKGRNLAGAEAAYRQAVELFAPSGDPNPRPPHVVVEHVTARQRLAAILADGGKLRDAQQLLEAAAADLRPILFAGPPAGRHARDPLAATLDQLAGVLDQLGDNAGGWRARGEAERVRMPGHPPHGGFPPKGPPPKGPPPKKPPDFMDDPFKRPRPPPPKK
ncbi:MAG: serine/threonine protein kinase [Gemmataceae bacterium]|nr:serine/threonine protein kinase [Gemmataceae bacterium]